ncbi:hypothetical protein [Pedobacter gandavensis]|uniref:DUF262 domain-containing protein n=1 Tax=Pedobacter gandavensis TaxID=2679963 RepID=A0ABR6EQ57_9SPHI|nr:hypothetical protein [Pedobacter gandavensis]MBB2147375.1 hypothetical protein [Pedobacter gandavensis]
MDSFEIIGTTKDLRTNTDIYYAQISIEDYLKLVGEDFDRFDIQRPRQDYRAYSRMKKDIIDGALLPTITLAINPKEIQSFEKLFSTRDVNSLSAKLLASNSIYILDGLQRTYILNDINKDGFKFKNGQKLLVEFWLEKEIKHLIYRLIVLNAGQKPMSMRHQVELLFITMQDKIQEGIDGLTLISERDESRRSKPKQFPFDRIVVAYYSFITKSAMIKRDNIVVQELNEMEVINSNEDELNQNFTEFLFYLNIYTSIDNETFRIYNHFTDIKVKGPQNWFAEEITITSFFAAISQFATDEKRKERINKALERFLEKLVATEKNIDILALNVLSDIREGISPKKYNVGIETRKILTNGFKEFFREEGESSFEDCWKNGTN